MLLDVLAVTTAFTPLNFTSLLAAVGLKLAPVSVTELAIAPEEGENDVMAGTGDGSFLLHEFRMAAQNKARIVIVNPDFMEGGLLEVQGRGDWMKSIAACAKSR